MPSKNTSQTSNESKSQVSWTDAEDAVLVSVLRVQKEKYGKQSGATARSDACKATFCCPSFEDSFEIGLRRRSVLIRAILYEGRGVERDINRIEVQSY
jgi:hypothetical protein